MQDAAERTRRPIVGVLGASQPTSESAAAAREVGRLVAERGWIVLTGGRAAGVMAAACAGAKQIHRSLTLGILPGAGGDVAPGVDIAVFTGMGDARTSSTCLPQTCSLPVRWTRPEQPRRCRLRWSRANR